MFSTSGHSVMSETMLSKFSSDWKTELCRVTAPGPKSEWKSFGVGSDQQWQNREFLLRSRLAHLYTPGALGYYSERRDHSCIVKQRHKPKVHMKLLVAVE